MMQSCMSNSLPNKMLRKASYLTFFLLLLCKILMSVLEGLMSVQGELTVSTDREVTAAHVLRDIEE